MVNKKRYISANEINQYVYCPYQWYYIKKYGLEYINSLRSPSEKEEQFVNFKKGIEYHEKYYKDIIKMRYRKYILFFGIVLLILAILILMRYVK
jgi:CRISPR/Cas system-associated exonuclease Cas4 (RecB family)